MKQHLDLTYVVPSISDPDRIEDQRLCDVVGYFHRAIASKVCNLVYGCGRLVILVNQIAVEPYAVSIRYCHIWNNTSHW